jgi:hypothetical protein
LGGKVSSYFLYAVGEIVLVVIGILIALSINNWNENKKKRVQERFILENLKIDLQVDRKNIMNEMETITLNIKNLSFCTDAVLDRINPSRELFIRNLNSLLTINNFDQNKTTFNNIVSSGQIEYIHNQELIDSITQYYNFDYKGWDTALRDYTRNIIAPFMLNFDHIPQANIDRKGFEDFMQVDINESRIAAKTLDDYRDEVFILNILRQKLWNLQGQLKLYQNLSKTMGRLIRIIEIEIDTF